MRQIAAPVAAFPTPAHAAAAPLAAACLLGILFATAAGARPAPGDPAAAAPDPTTAAMAHAHAHDAPLPSPAVGRPGGPEKVTAATVDYGPADGGKPLRGYLARPEGASKGGPALIVIHEWWGLNDNVRDLARQFASHGYTALAVDLYGGAAAQDPDQAKALMSAAMKDTAAVEENLRQASRYLHDTPGTKVGVIGWCFGGGWSLQTALLVPHDISAVVMYYGRPELDRDKLSRLEAPLLGLFGAEDQAIKVDGVRQFEGLLQELHKDASIHVYPGAGHAFANPSGTNYVKPAADDAWKLTLDFLRKYLAATGPAAAAP